MVLNQMKGSEVRILQFYFKVKWELGTRVKEGGVKGDSTALGTNPW